MKAEYETNQMIKEYLEQFEYINTLECFQHEINSKLISQKMEPEKPKGKVTVTRRLLPERLDADGLQVQEARRPARRKRSPGQPEEAIRDLEHFFQTLVRQGLSIPQGDRRCLPKE